MIHRFAQRQLRLGAVSLLGGAALMVAYALTRRAFPPATEPFDIDDTFLGMLVLLNAATAFALMRAARMVGRVETRRGEAEREVQRRRAWLESVVENMPVGVGVIDGASDRLVLSNAVYRDLLQVAGTSEPMHHGHRGIRLYDRRGEFLDRVDWPSSRALLHGETSRDVELQIEMADGRRRWVAVSAAPIRGDPDGASATVVAFSDITARKLAETERETLLQRLVEVQEAERLHFARELHDELGQELTALLIGLKGVETAASDELRNERLAGLREMAGRMHDQVHHLAGDLRPLILEDLGLLAAVEELALGWGSKLGIEVDLLLDGLGEPIEPDVAIAIYRVVQEALTNVARHSAARSLAITAQRTDGVLRLAVEDDGRGFDPADAGARRAHRTGLVGMRERLAAVGGTLDIESSPAAGTTVYVTVPLADGRGAHDERRQASRVHRGRPPDRPVGPRLASG